MSTDRELYVMVAKAAGITGYVCEDWNGLYFCTPANPEIPRSEPVFYRWLLDDGDTLRLAVKLGMRLFVYPEGESSVFADTMHEPIHWVVTRKDDACLATRRAIVRAAAEIGRAMP